MRYSDIENMTNEEAVAYFAPITNSYVPCGDLENLLGWAELAKRNAVTGAWEGSLIDFMASNAVPALSGGLGELFSHLNKPRSIGCDTNSQPWASKMTDLLLGLELVEQITPVFTVDVIELAGGLAYPDVSVESVQDLRDEEAQRLLDEEAAALEAAAGALAFSKLARYNELYNIHVAPLVDAKSSDDASWVAALQAMSDNFVA